MAWYLLDTNILVFLITEEDDELSREVDFILDDYYNQIETSSISMMELVQLCRIGKIKLKKGTKLDDLPDYIHDVLGISIVNFGKEHTKTLSNLEIAAGHKDPFDHSIISHAITDRYTLISSDGKFKDYEKQNLNFVYNKR